jgi:DNA-directed RNA polymerase subunit RPC12/RpoP
MKTHSKTCGSLSNYKTGKQKDMSHSKRRRSGQPFILNVHFTCKYHDTIPTYGCMMCDEKFSERHNLNSHIYNLHYPYSCTICGEIFNKEKALIEHSRSCTFIMCRKNKPEHLNQKTIENPAIGKDNIFSTTNTTMKIMNLYRFCI